MRGKLPYFLPCAAHMKIRESSTLKFITKNFSAKHHINFSEALTFSSGRFQSISHAKRGVRCPKGIETRLNFRRKPAKLSIVHYALCIDLSEAPIQPHANCALNKPQSPPPASKNNLILSEQSERFNFSPKATHPVTNVIVHWIKPYGYKPQYLTLLCIMHCALIKASCSSCF